MPYRIKTSISFGMVYIPVQLEAAVRKNEISFNQLDKKTGSRIRYIKTCDDCNGKEVTSGDIIKAYQYEKNRYVTFTESDFEKIKTNRDKSIIIDRFVPQNDIDALYYDKPYFVLPAGADKAYALLVQAMQLENKVGIAKTVLGTKETLVALIVREGQLCLSTLHFYSEIQPVSINVKAEIAPQEIKLAQEIIQNMSGEFEAEQYKDEYSQRVLLAIEQKIAGEEITQPKESSDKIIDLMEALKASLSNVTGKTGEGKKGGRKQKEYVKKGDKGSEKGNKTADNPLKTISKTTKAENAVKTNSSTNKTAKTAKTDTKTSKNNTKTAISAMPKVKQ